MYELRKGRPSDTSGRLEKEIRCYDYLEKLGIEFYSIDNEPAHDMETCRKIDRQIGAETCKNLVLCNRQQTKFYLLLTKGDKPFKTKDLSAQIGSARLSFASPEKMEEYLDCTPGSASILGLMNDTSHSIELLIDSDIKSAEYFACHPCINTTTVKFKTSELFEKLLPSFDRDYTVVTL